LATDDSPVKHLDDERTTDALERTSMTDAAPGRLLPRPADLFRLGPHDSAHLPAARVAVSVVVPLVVLALLGHLEWAPYATFGAFASAFGRALPRRQRLGMQLEAGAGLVACVVLGAALSSLSTPATGLVVVVAVVAGLASLVSDLRRWSPPGPLFFVFGLGVCAFVPADGAAVAAAAVVAPASLGLALLASSAGALTPSGRRALASEAGRVWRRAPRLLDRRRTLVHAGICLLASLVAGLISVAAGFENPYWAMVSAVVPVVGSATATQLVRAGHRLLGTLAGVVVAAGLLALQPSTAWLIVEFGALQFAAELAVMRNYGLTLLFVTPMALGMSALAGPVDIGELVVWRGVDTLVGVGVVVVLLLATHRLRTPVSPGAPSPDGRRATTRRGRRRPGR
jgi:hypothetical protein